ncbi:hypothetical protein FQR65_LT00267 [Abscondita terminalis]|nr:hypothetical protein FQR65_LT00267 [Abscondita terminalis]
MNEEKQEGPKWLKELEEKRERRVKARLGHETGAGSPCLTCENKCPGLDLHFWRKICKNCKCGKENHDVNDDDIYGWAQFQLLGSKPSKGKKLVLPGRNDAVELEWAPKGQGDIVDTYLKETPINMLPIKGSPAAQERKQLLQKQIPLHDIDPSLCHALTDNEIKKMNDYIAHVKQNSVGVGNIYKMNEILKTRLLNPQYRTKRVPMQLSQTQNIALRGVDRATVLKDPHLSNLHKNLNELHFSNNGVTGAIRDITYPIYGSSDNVPVNDNIPQYSKLISGKESQQKELSMHVPNQPFSNQIDNQPASKIKPIKDVHAQLHSDSHPKAVYPDMNTNYKLGDLKANPELLHLANVPQYDSTCSQMNDLKVANDSTPKQNDNTKGVMRLQLKANPELLHLKNIPQSIEQNPKKINNIKDLMYSTYTQYNPNELNIDEQSVEPENITVGLINDIEYPTIKTAEQVENDFVPAISTVDNCSWCEVFPSCHGCKIMFDVSSLVIGIGHSDSLWHLHCFKCVGCNQNLADMMYFYHKESGEIYCGRDYAKIRGIPRCQACDELIFVKEYCLAENSTFHIKHFCCYECDKPLAGQNYVMEDSQPLCVPCFEMIKAEKCRACSMVIKPDEKGVNLNGVHFHANDRCFCCKTCKKALLNAKMLFKNSNPYCSAVCFGADK